jgi:hypothetical protein
MSTEGIYYCVYTIAKTQLGLPVVTLVELSPHSVLTLIQKKITESYLSPRYW